MLQNIRNMPVMKEMCKSCPFRANGCEEVRSTVISRVLSVASQTCHSTGVAIGKKEDTHICRGARDLQIQFFYGLGFIEEPTDEAWNKKREELGI